MDSIPLARSEYLLSLVAELRRRGAPVEALLEKADLPVRIAPGCFVPTRATWRFAELAGRWSRCDDFGLLVGMQLSPAQIESWLVACESSCDLGAALESWCKLVSIESSGVQIWTEACAEGAWLCYQGTFGPEQVGFRVVEQYMIGMLLGVLRDWLGPLWAPGAVRLRASRPEPSGASSVLMRARVRAHDDRTGLLVPLEELQSPPGSIAVGATRDEQRPRRPADDLVGSLEQALESYVGEQRSLLELAARLAGTSTRTLQRRIAMSGGRRLSELVDDLRKQAALQRVEDGDPSLTDVAFELGYSDPAHFTRAFKRWTDFSPKEWRAARIDSA